MNKIKRVKIINKFVKITQSGGELGKLNNSFFKLLFLVIFLNLLSFASFGATCSFSYGILTVSGEGELTRTKVTDAVNLNGKRITDIKKVIIKSGITSIGNNAFRSCSSLIEITVDGTNSIYKDINGVLFTKNGKQLICYPAGKVGSSYEIPKDVTNIGDYAFEGCMKLTSITIPSSAMNIGDMAFRGCTKLTSVIIPGGVKNIGMNAFEGCTKLKSVIIPKSVISIGDYAFRGCTKLTSITIPNRVDNLISIGNNVFYNCSNLKDVYYLGTMAQWVELQKKISSDDIAELADATIHYNCKPKTLTVNKVWKDNSNSSLRSEPTFVLYKVYTGCTKSGESEYTSDKLTFTVNSDNGNYAKEENGTYTVYEKMAEKKYTQGKFSNNVGGDTNTWQYKITVFNHEADNTYAVSEDPMVGYTSSAPTP